MRSDYLKKVTGRLLSLGKTALKPAVQVVVDAAIITLVEKSCNVIKSKLKEMYIQTVINSSINLSLNIVGILILYFKPFGYTVAFCLASFFFLVPFCLWLFRTVRFLKENGKMAMEVIKSIWKEKHVYRGIEQFVLNSFPFISLTYSGIAIADKFVPVLKEVPSISELVKYFVEYFWKQFALFVSVVGIYTVTVFWIIKPIILKSII